MKRQRFGQPSGIACVAVALGALGALGGCDRSEPQPQPQPGATTAAPRGAAVVPPKVAKTDPPSAPGSEPIPYRFPKPARLVAIGDVHGDLDAARRALRLAGAIDENDQWIGGDLVVVQTGDQLDRGDQERAIVDLFERLSQQAKQTGGAVHPLNGNHETMNVAGDFRYVTPGGFRDFADIEEPGASPARVNQQPPGARGRARAFFPGGPYAKKLATRNTIAIVGDTVFVHGGVLPEHVSRGIGNINQEISAWMTDPTATMPTSLRSESAPVWTRDYSSEKTGDAECQMLEQVLQSLKAKRMVVGHTPQKHGVTSACDEKVWRVDVGLAAHYGGNASSTQVLEVKGDHVRVLRGTPSP
jgi:hypothetical protein